MKRSSLFLLIGVMLVTLVVASSISLCAGSAILSEDFSAKNVDAFFSAAYKALKSDATKPMYLATGGTCVVENGALTLTSSRFTAGALAATPTTAASTPGGALDLSKPFVITFKVVAVSGDLTKKLQVYIDNNTTGMANSPLGGASRVYSEVLGGIKAGSTVEIKCPAATASSFIQFRVESGAIITIDDLLIQN